MSFYLRKAVKVGPFRFNLSKSGVGVSVGIKGFRVGSGPNGNYVHMGRGGLYYRKTFPNNTKSFKLQQTTIPTLDRPTIPRYTQQQDDVIMQEIESSDVSNMIDSSSSELLQELTEKRKKWRMGPLFMLLTVFSLLTLLITKQVHLLAWIIALVFLLLAIYGFFRDTLVKTTVLLYNIDSTLQSGYAKFFENALLLASCSACWHISASGAVRDSKYYAGASTLLSRKRTWISKSSPPFLKTNIDVIGIGVGRQTLYFFPDRILVYDAGRVGAIGYDQLQVRVEQEKFIESDVVPGDARVIDKTWQFVNKKGGPDKRFANNRELPICLYEKVYFSTSTGLNEIIQISRCNIGESLANAIRYLSDQLLTASSEANHQFHIGKNGEDLGEFPLSTIISMIHSGSLTLNDYYYDSDTSSWEYIDKLIN